MDHIYDLIIVGAGPAGITSAVYAARKKMDFMVFTKDIGGKVIWSPQIENYMGYQFITGEDLTQKFKHHLQAYKFKMNQKEVIKVSRRGNIFITDTKTDTFFSKTLILATGRIPRKINVPGENKLLGRGVTYCVTCDGPLFNGLNVAVVGGGNAGLEAVIQLSKIAKNIKIIEVMPKLMGDLVLIEKVNKLKNVNVLTNTKVTEIFGKEVVSGIKVKKDNKETTFTLRGVFVEIGSIPNSDIVDFVNKNQWNEIIVNNECETNVQGFYAAGDVTNISAKQIIVAAGEGAKATLKANTFLAKNT